MASKWTVLDFAETATVVLFGYVEHYSVAVSPESVVSALPEGGDGGM